MAAWVWALVSSLTSSAGSPGTSHASAVSRLPAPQTWSRSCSSAAGRATLHHGWMGQRPQRRSPERTKTLGQSSMTAHFRQILLQQEPECHSNIKHWKYLLRKVMLLLIWLTAVSQAYLPELVLFHHLSVVIEMPEPRVDVQPPIQTLLWVHLSRR